MTAGPIPASQGPRAVLPAGSRQPMHDRELAALADDVAAACARHGVPAWDDGDRDRLEEALWQFIHPDLIGTKADPWHSLYDD